ncbi:MAG: hypothetical protein ACOYNY_28245 [Caldilineaceae bacterium]|jgi:hypothetical protein
MTETFSSTTSASTTTYASYLLRLRWHRQEDEWVCQIMLTSVTTGEQCYFSSQESLFAYLQAQRDAGKGGAAPLIVRE